MSASPPSPLPGRRLNGGPALIVASVVAVAAQLYGLYGPDGPPQPEWFPAADKLAHLLGFAIPVVLVLCALTWYGGRRRRAGLVLGLFALHGVVSEIVQARLYANRSGDVFDLLADWLGIALGAGAFLAVRPAVVRLSVGRRVVVSP
jgi:VanZ family protein